MPSVDEAPPDSVTLKAEAFAAQARTEDECLDAIGTQRTEVKTSLAIAVARGVPVVCGRWLADCASRGFADPTLPDKQGRSAEECKGEAEEEAQAWDRQDSLMEVTPSKIWKHKDAVIFRNVAQFQ